MELKIDLHSHSAFSQDGISKLKAMIKMAMKQGVSYYGISEHINFDYCKGLNRLLRPINIVAYFKNARRMQKKYSNKINLLVGCEFGYTDDEKAYQDYEKIIKDYKPDYIINSVHSIGGLDFAILGKLFTKEEMYDKYLSVVRKSIDANYSYDIVGHIGYVIRYVENGNGIEFFKNNKTKIEDILKAIIDKDKILEVNTSTYGLEQKSIPDEQILKLYYQLGGRKISYGSDAHSIERILDKWDNTVEMLKSIGFTSFTIPLGGIHKEIKI